MRFADPDQGLSFGEQYQASNDAGSPGRHLPAPATSPTSRPRTGSSGHSFDPVCDARTCGCSKPPSPTRRWSGSVPSSRSAMSMPLSRCAGTRSMSPAAMTCGRRTNDGFSWRHPDNPCGGGSQAFATWSEKGLAAECTPVRGVGSLFESMDAGQHWTNIANVPHVRAAAGSLSAGSPNELLITTGTGAPFVSHHHGNNWTRGRRNRRRDRRSLHQPQPHRRDHERPPDRLRDELRQRADLDRDAVPGSRLAVSGCGTATPGNTPGRTSRE